MTHKICDACETVSHCSRHGCIPLEPVLRRQTTPEEAKTLALRHGFYTTAHPQRLAADFSAIVALIDEVVASKAPSRGVDAEPVIRWFNEFMRDHDVTPMEQLRFFCSLAADHPAPSQPAVASAPVQPVVVEAPMKLSQGGMKWGK